MIGDIIKGLRTRDAITQETLGKAVGVTTSMIGMYETNARRPSIKILSKIANYFGVSTDYLLGSTGNPYEVIIRDDELPDILKPFLKPDSLLKMEVEGKDINNSKAKTIAIEDFLKSQNALNFPELNNLLMLLPNDLKNKPLSLYDLFSIIGQNESLLKKLNEEDAKDDWINQDLAERIDLPRKTVRIPVLGSIPAGMPVEAVNDIIGWEEIPEDWTHGERQYFGLKVKGDSMFPEYLAGDTVIIRKQPCCDSGDDCAVMVNDTDATLKRVHLYKDGIELEAINPMYGKKKFTNKEVEKIPVSILGVIVELRRKKK